MSKEFVKDGQDETKNGNSKKNEALGGTRNGKRRRGRGRGRNGKGGRPGPQYNKGTKFNDVSYYTKNTKIVEAFAKLPFNYINGNSMPSLKDGQMVEVPVIISYFIDWVANSRNKVRAAAEDVQSMLDMVATIVYTNMRRHNSGSTNNIEYLDVLITNLIASVDIMANAHYLNRMFKLINSFNWKNRTIPKHIFVNHFGIDYEDFVANQAAYRGKYNTLVALARTIRTLNNYPFINAIMDEFNNIFKDTDTDTGREQYIVSVKPFHHIYDPVGTDQHPGGQVRIMVASDVSGYIVGATHKNKPIFTAGRPSNVTTDYPLMKFSTLLDIFRTQIYALINDSDFNLIQADIEKAFGDQGSGYIVVDSTPDDEVLHPVYSGEFLTMFENGLFYPIHQVDEVVRSTTSGNSILATDRRYVNSVFQISEGVIGNTANHMGTCVAMALADSSLAFSDATRIVNTDSNDPDINEIVIMTRFRTLIEKGAPSTDDLLPAVRASGDTRYVLSVGSNFICFGGLVSTVRSYSGSADVVVQEWENTISVEGPATGHAEGNASLYALSKYPLQPVESAPVVNQMDNIKYITASELLGIHDACFLSLWNVPEQAGI